MSFWNLAFCGGRLTRLPYWIAMLSLVVAFFISAIAFPAFILIVLPCCYLATCWLANRLRDAAWPAFLAIFPIFIAVGSLMFYLVTSVLTIGLHKQSQTLGTYVPWIIGSIFLAAGLLPSTRRSPRPTGRQVAGVGPPCKMMGDAGRHSRLAEAIDSRA